MTDPADCGRLAQAALKEFGRIDVLVNNAGVASAVPALKEDPEEFAEVVAVNLQGPLQHGEGRGRRHGEHGGSIINVSSVLALTTGRPPPRPPTRPARQRFSA